MTELNFGGGGDCCYRTAVVLHLLWLIGGGGLENKLEKKTTIVSQYICLVVKLVKTIKNNFRKLK